MTDRYLIMGATINLFQKYGNVKLEKLYSEYGVSEKDIKSEFVSLPVLLHLVGLGFVTEYVHKQIMNTQADYRLISDLLEVGRKHGNNISKEIYEKEGKFSVEDIENDAQDTFENVLNKFHLDGNIEPYLPEKIYVVDEQKTDKFEKIKEKIEIKEEINNMKNNAEENNTDIIVATETKYEKIPINKDNDPIEFLCQMPAEFEKQESVDGKVLYHAYVEWCNNKQVKPTGKKNCFKCVSQVFEKRMNSDKTRKFMSLSSKKAKSYRNSLNKNNKALEKIKVEDCTINKMSVFRRTLNRVKSLLKSFLE